MLPLRLALPGQLVLRADPFPSIIENVFNNACLPGEGSDTKLGMVAFTQPPAADGEVSSLRDTASCHLGTVPPSTRLGPTPNGQLGHECSSQSQRSLASPETL